MNFKLFNFLLKGLLNFKPFSDQGWIRYSNVDNFEKWLFSIVVSLQNGLAHFYCRKTHWNHQNLTLVSLEKRQYLPHYWSDKDFNCTVVNRAMHERKHKIVLTIPLILTISFIVSETEIRKSHCVMLNQNWSKISIFEMHALTFRTFDSHDCWKYGYFIIFF